MKSDRRQFMQAAGTAGAALFALQTASGDDTVAPAANRTTPAEEAPFTTELFLDNQLLEATPGISRKLHPAGKHLLNPVIRPDRWCEGTYLQPYTSMYDAEEKLFKIWARAGSDAKAGYVGGNAAWMVYYTSKNGVDWEKPDPGVCDVGGRRDHNIIFASDMIPKAPTPLKYGPEKFVMPTTPMVPQGRKAFFWGVNKHSQPRDPSENYVALAIVQDHRRGAHIATSPDGVHWSCAASPFWQTPHDVDESAWEHYSGGVALATLKRDRFASLETGTPDAEPCRILTKPLVVSHPRLYLNAATWAKGSIRVEVLTRDWQPIPGFTVAESQEIQGDALDHPVRWSDNADMSKLLGHEIRLKFHMTRARLHAMTMSGQERPLRSVEAGYRSDPEGDSSPREN